jgi:UDP-N-acetylmuramoyl-L-alanyl-D-glutamate--2,6-diaminopimelate ligase
MSKKAQQTPCSCSLSWLLSSLFIKPLFDENSGFSDICLTGLSLDSRAIKRGDLFVALQGAISDGRVFITNAIQAGASAILSETTHQDEHGLIHIRDGIPVIAIFELHGYLNALAMRFYFPHNNLHHITAVTGTNGKTTIASLLANCYQLLGRQSAQMGTIGNGLYGQLQASLNTTLDAISVCRSLHDYQHQGAEHTVMEVSSHGLMQGRVAAIPFTTAIFTNLTRDHLDYHGTMQAYADAKQKLFNDFPLQHRIINADDPVGQSWLKQYPDAIAYGVNAQASIDDQSFFIVKHIRYLAQGITFDFDSSWGVGTIAAPFYGDFNVSNIAAVSCALLADGFSIAQIESVMAKLTVVPGRMEQYFFPEQKLTFVVDYAHTPDALANALKALANHKQQGRIIAVFGCGGDRDKGKRPEMARMAEQGADQVIIVDDNPRSENPQSIVDDIKKGLEHPEQTQVIHDRKQAILHLLQTAQTNDIILIAGKGHEDYQIFGDKKVHYSDRECLTALLDIEKNK